jgi:hypothetical protein
LVGFTAIETRAAGVTTNVVEPWIEPRLALITAEPLATLVAEPWLPTLLLMVAIAGVSELHWTLAVTS